MRILLITQTYHPHVGGVEYVVKSIAERLVRLGHDVTVLAGEPAASKPSEEEVGGVRVVRWPSWTPAGAYHIPKRRQELEEAIKKLAKDVDVIHAHNAHAVFTVWTAALAKRINPSTRLLFTPHYHGGGHTAVRRLLWIPWRRYVARLVETADAVHAVSPREARLIERHYPAARSKIVVIPNGVEEDVFNYRWQGADSDYMIYAGRVERYKSLETAVDLAKEMGLKLLIIGRGPHKEKLKKYAQRRRAAVEFLDPQPRERYLQLLAGARYAINPSRHEAYSVFVAEALATGVPAVTTPEVAENLGAFRRPFKNGLVLANAPSPTPWREVMQKYLHLYQP